MEAEKRNLGKPKSYQDVDKVKADGETLNVDCLMIGTFSLSRHNAVLESVRLEVAAAYSADTPRV